MKCGYPDCTSEVYSSLYCHYHEEVKLRELPPVPQERDAWAFEVVLLAIAGFIMSAGVSFLLIVLRWKP